MTRWLLAAAVLLASVHGATYPLSFPGPSTKAHPAIAALRNYTARVETNLGTFTLELYPDAAPNAVRCFVKAALRGLYDGSRVTAVFKDKLLVVGDGRKGENVEFEESALSAVAGSVAFDRDAEGKNEVGRLRVILDPKAKQDREYTVFAEIRDGLSVARRLGAVPTRGAGKTPVPVEEVLIEKVVLETSRTSE